MNKKIILVILVFFGVMLVACGGSVGSTSETVNLASPTQNAPTQSTPVMVTSEAQCPTCPLPIVELTDQYGNPLPTAVVETPEALPTGTPHPDEITQVGAEHFGQWELYIYWVPQPEEELVIIPTGKLPISVYGFGRTAIGSLVNRNDTSEVYALFVKVEEDPTNIVASFTYQDRENFLSMSPPPLQ